MSKRLSKGKKLSGIALFGLLLFALPVLVSAQDDQPAEKKRKKPQKREQRRVQPQSQEVDIEVKDEEIDKLVELQQELQPLQMETQKEMRSNIQGSELGQQRYMEVRRARANGEDPDLTEEEEEQLAQIETKNKETRENMQNKMEKKVEEKGMEWERFQKVSKAIQQDPELKKRFRKAHKEKQGGGQQRPQPKQKKEQKQQPEREEGGGGR